MTYIRFLFAKSQTWQLIWNEKLTSEGIRCTIGAHININSKIYGKIGDNIPEEQTY